MAILIAPTHPLPTLVPHTIIDAVVLLKKPTKFLKKIIHKSGSGWESWCRHRCMIYAPNKFLHQHWTKNQEGLSFERGMKINKSRGLLHVRLVPRGNVPLKPRLDSAVFILTASELEISEQTFSLLIRHGNAEIPIEISKQKHKRKRHRKHFDRCTAQFRLVKFFNTSRFLSCLLQNRKHFMNSEFFTRKAVEVHLKK